MGPQPCSEPRVAEADWYAIVLSWNGREDTEHCLDARAKVREPPVRIVCVDNGSSDGSVEAVRDRHPEANLIENGRKLASRAAATSASAGPWPRARSGWCL
jgi:glycosyltransferase involved in cell wall biosynthesis